MNTWTGLVVTAAVVSVMGSGVSIEAASGGGIAAGPTAEPRQAPGGSIVSFVRDQSGRPLAGAIVSAVGRRIVTSVTDEQGRCVFSALPAGDYLVRVHRTGYASTSSLLVLAGPGANSTWSFVLKVQASRGFDPRQAAKPAPDILAAGFVGNTALEPAEAQPAEDEASHDHSEVAWRLKHLKRSVLKEATDSAIFEEGGDPDEFDRAVADLFTRQDGPMQVAASLLSDFPLAGQVNLLTTGAFDSPQQLMSAGSLARGVAMVSLGSSTGSMGDWAVQGAMTQGDVASWMVSGSYLTRAPARHVLDVGMSYSLQRYDGSNPAALAALSDGNRYAGMVYAIDSWAISDRISLAYGARFANYGYIDKALLSPRARLTIAPIDTVRLSVGASRRALAPGAEEFVPSMVAGTWLPPERTFAPIKGSSFVPERTRHLDVALEHDLTESTMVGVRAFTQRTKDQIVTLFGVGGGLERQTSDLGHYWVGTAGDVDAHGYTVSVRQVIARRVRGSVDYTVATSEWRETAASNPLARRLPSLARTGTERLHDVTTTIETELPITETRVFALYRINTGYVGDRLDDLENAPDARFDVQVTQSLPFMNFSNAQWEMLLGVRNLFRDIVEEASMYDELLVVRPPKRIVGGLTLRF
jgi:hypothetical protein